MVINLLEIIKSDCSTVDNGRNNCSPVTLFTADVRRYCPENYAPIKVLMALDSGLPFQYIYH